MAKRNVITNAAIYLGENLFGKATEVELPEIEQNTVECKDLGSIGEYDLNTLNIKKMKCKITLNSFYKEVFNRISNPAGSVSMTIYGDMQEYENDAIVAHKPVKVTLRGTCNKFPLLGNLKAQENLNYPMEFSITAAAKYEDGEELYYIDVINCIWRKGGIDIFAAVRANLGLT